MKVISLLSILYILMYCKAEKTPNFYHAYVVNEELTPLDSVRVRDNLSNNSHIAYTNKEGYFKLKKDKDVLADLIFEKTLYISDTVQTVTTQHGEIVQYMFLNEVADTIVLKHRE